MMNKRTKALIVEEHQLLRFGLATLLRHDCGFDAVFEAATIEDGLRTLGDHDDLAFAIVDLDASNASVIGTLRNIRAMVPHLVIAVTATSERRDDILSALAAGMHGYIPKRLSSSAMVSALEAILNGAIFVPPSITQIQPPGEMPTSTAPSGSGPVRLSNRQTQVLDQIRTGRSNKEIARALGLTENTVKVHVNSLFRTLGVRNRVSAASCRAG